MKLAGTRHFRSNDRHRRFESIPLHHTVIIFRRDRAGTRQGETGVLFENLGERGLLAAIAHDGLDEARVIDQ
jgi:hypothetical protein